MGALGQYNKAWVALLIPLLTFANQKWGLSLPVDSETLGLIVAAVTSALVYVVPNKGA